MKRLAYLLMGVGVLIGVIAFNLDVTVGDTGITNINMMAQRQNLLMVGCVGFLAGIVLLVGTQQQRGSKAYSKVGEQNETENTKSVAVGLRISSAIKAGSEFFETYIVKRDAFIYLIVKTIGGISSAIVAQSVINKVVYTLVDDVFYGKVNRDIWGHPAVFYIPVMVFIFLAVMRMRSGLSILVRVFYVELAVCVAGVFIFTLIYGNWLEVLKSFSLEIGFCVLGVILIKRLGSKVSLVG